MTMESGTWVRLTKDRKTERGQDIPKGTPAKFLDAEDGVAYIEVTADLWHLPVPADEVEPLPVGLIPLAELRVPFRTPWGDDAGNTVGSVRLLFTGDQWKDIIDKGGRWLASCCANISAMRDILISCLRESGWLDAKDLVELIGLMQTHDSFDHRFEDDYDPDSEKTESGRDPDPFFHIWEIWMAAKDVLERTPHINKYADDVTDLEEAISGLSHSSRMMHYLPMFSRPENYDPDQFPTLDKAERNKRRRESRHRSRKHQATTLLTLVPCLHTVVNHIRNMYPEPVSGFAICLTAKNMWVDREDPDTGETIRVSEDFVETDKWGYGIIQIRDGLAVFPDEADIERTLVLWEKQTPDIRERVKVVPVTVTVEGGIVLHEDGKPVETTPTGGWWPTPERMGQLDQLRGEGHVVVLKLDGARRDDGNNPDYTAAILGEGGYHADTMAEAVDQLIDAQKRDAEEKGG